MAVERPGEELCEQSLEGQAKRLRAGAENGEECLTRLRKSQEPSGCCGREGRGERVGPHGNRPLWGSRLARGEMEALRGFYSGEW